MEDWEIIKGVSTLVRICAGVKEGEEVLIVTDTGIPSHIPEALALICIEVGADAQVIKMTPRKVDGSEPPKVVAGAIENSDVILEITSVFVHHSNARAIACERGARYLYIGGLDDNLLKGPGALDADFLALAPQVQQLRELRDNYLMKTESGSSFMGGFNQLYYLFSPTIADLERESPVFKEVVKLTITPLISSLSILNYVDMDSEAKVLGYGISLILLNIGMYIVAPAGIGFFVIRRKF